MGLRDSKSITAAAILYRGKIYALPRPARHHDIIRYILEETGEESIGENEQGFLDDKGQFLRRAVAMTVARWNKMPFTDKAPILRELYSENLW